MRRVVRRLSARLWSRSADVPPPGPPSPVVLDVRTESHPTDDQLQIALEQYRALHSESLQAETLQHQALQWTLAAAVVVLAAAFVTDDQGASFNLKVVTLGFAVPTFIFLASLSWLGEVRRMVRVGYYLRWLERRVRELAEAATVPPSTYADVLGWERSLSRAPDAPVPTVGGRNNEGYIGSLGIYLGAEIASVLAMVITWWSRDHWLRHHGLGALLPWIAVGLEAVFVLITVLVVFIRVRPLATREAPATDRGGCAPDTTATGAS